MPLHPPHSQHQKSLPFCRALCNRCNRVHGICIPWTTSWLTFCRCGRFRQDLFLGRAGQAGGNGWAVPGADFFARASRGRRHRVGRVCGAIVSPTRPIPCFAELSRHAPMGWLFRHLPIAEAHASHGMEQVR